MIPKRVLQNLEDIVGGDHFLTRPERTRDFATDATDLEYVPEAVVFPADADQVARILVLANRDGFPVIPRGGGSGKTGGALAVQGGVILAMDRFDRILRIDRENLVARVEPGVITERFQREVEKQGLFYPPDPASVRISTIGGNVASCAGGLRAVKYGVTRDYVLGLGIVLPTGEYLETGVSTAKGVVGYDLTRLIVGSEGTLAVITAVTLRLLRRPATKKTMLAFFRKAETAVRTVTGLLGSGILPTTLEFMDRRCLACLRGQTEQPIPDASGALLLIEVDGDKHHVADESERVRRHCLQSGALAFRDALDDADANRLWDLRRDISEAIFVYGPQKISEDIVVPRNRMAEAVSFLEELGARHGLTIPAFGHAGDGNLHVNIMYDKSKPGDVRKAEIIVRELFEETLRMGGTISGEHGVGLTKAPYLDMEISGPAIALMSRLKWAFDPMGILNPGKIFPPRPAPPSDLQRELE